MHAILSKREEISSLLMEYSVSLRAVDVQWGWTALHCAAHVGMVNVLKELLNKRASPYTTSKVSKPHCVLRVMQKSGVFPTGYVIAAVLLP